MRFILHGKAAQRADVREAVGKMRGAGCDVDVRVTWEEGDTGRFAREALDQGVDTIVAGGGDGSLNETVNALVEADATGRCTLGLVPLGTANDFARAACIPVNDPWAALQVVAKEPAQPIDYGLLNGKAFINIATGGAGTRITAETPEGMKRVLGGVAYVISGAMRMADIVPQSLRVQVGEERWEGDVYVMAVGNGRQAGGGMPLFPGAVLNDGLLDVAVLPADAVADRFQTLSDLIESGAAALDKYLLRWRGAAVAIEAPGGIDISLDGEPERYNALDFSLQHRALQMHLPAHAISCGALQEN